MSTEVLETRDLDDGIDRFLRSGYRIDMIMPADAPREVLMSKGASTVRLRSKNRIHSGNTDWTIGRAGMRYRDLIPRQPGGKLIASEIQLTQAGNVPDNVH